MQTTTFKIFNASAGSGKTHTLVKEYLKLILINPINFRQTLAITFTNKAVNEMKERILSSLYDFGLDVTPQKSLSLFTQVSNELKLSPAQLQQKSDRLLKEILHNYAYFDVSTIDKFTHRIIRTFAKDLKLPQNFEPVIDVEPLLDEAIARVLQKAGSNKELTDVLINFALEKIEDERSWNVTFDLTNIGKLLFNENHAEHIDKIRTKKMGLFIQLKDQLKQDSKKIEDQMVSRAKQALNYIIQNGFKYEDFKGQYLPTHFKRYIKREFHIGLYKNKLEFNLKNHDALKGKLVPNNLFFYDTLLQHYLGLKNLFFTYAFYKNIENNIIPLTVLSVIQKELDLLCKERDQLPLFKFNQIIAKEIKDQPAPFIFERLGEKYRHYFIDEFQDTSHTQWDNLNSLIDNALSGENASLLLVGDAKQAIYRWRGGEAEQLINLANGNVNPFVIQASTQNLPVNYRSYDQVIDFNNSFFKFSSEILHLPDYKELYASGSFQEKNSKQGGYVQIDFLEKDEELSTNELYCEKVLLLVNTILSKNHQLQDICILVRNNFNGVLLANYLTDQNIPIISSESLLLTSSPKVRFLINLLRYNTGFKEKAIAYEILLFLAENTQNKHTFIADNLEGLELFLESDYFFSFDTIKQLSVFDTLEYAIKQFNLVPESDAYVTFLMDVVLDVEQHEGESLQAFLTYWDKKSAKLAISASENINALRIMSVHKSKGLEFPIVIFPFTNVKIYGKSKHMWTPAAAEDFNGFNELLLMEKSEVLNYPHQAASIFEYEKQRMQLDALNVLYVALTRAVKATFIITETKQYPTLQNASSYIDLFTEFLKLHKNYTPNNFTYSFGEFEADNELKGKTQKNDISYLYTHKDRPHFKLMTKSGVLWETDRQEAITQGNIIHHILGKVKTKDDIPKAIKEAIYSGDISQNEAVDISQRLKNVVDHVLLAPYFATNVTIYNEKGILTNKGQLLRPDRIVINNKTAVIIDYKTGKINHKYKEQLYEYSDALTHMGFNVDQRVIVYINDTISVHFV